MSDLDEVISFFLERPGKWFTLGQVLYALGVKDKYLVGIYSGMKRKFRSGVRNSSFVCRPGTNLVTGRLVWEYCYKKRKGVKDEEGDC